MMNVLLTGATGFLGKIILGQIRLLNHEVKTLGRAASDDIKFDFSTNSPIGFTGAFELVVHCAGKAHCVPKTVAEKQSFFDVNVKGTQHLLNALEVMPSLPKSFVLISTVAVYGKEEGILINEECPLLAQDPYGLSKIEAEKIVQKWCDKHNVICSILRLPLIAGPNPPGNLKAMINGIAKGFYFDVAGGVAKKSIVLAKDVAQIIPAASDIGGIYNLTDGYHPSFGDLSKSIALKLGRNKPASIPLWMAILIAKVGDLVGKKAPINSKKLRKIISDLTFDDEKAKINLNWKPNSVLNGFDLK